MFSQRKSAPLSQAKTAARAADASAKVLCYGEPWYDRKCAIAKYSVLCYQFPACSEGGCTARFATDCGLITHAFRQCRNVKNLAFRVEPAAIPTRLPCETAIERAPGSFRRSPDRPDRLGDRLAMQVLYGRHHVRVFRFASGWCGTSKLRKTSSARFFSMCGVRLASSKADPPSQPGCWRLPGSRLSALRRRKERRTGRRDRERDRGHVRRSGSCGAEEGYQCRAAQARLTDFREHREIVDLVYYHEVRGRGG